MPAVVTATQQFAAVINGAVNPQVVWSVREGTAGGSVTSNGLYTAPEMPGTYHVVCSSVADPTKYAVATIVVQ